MVLFYYRNVQVKSRVKSYPNLCLLNTYTNHIDVQNNIEDILYNIKYYINNILKLQHFCYI